MVKIAFIGAGSYGFTVKLVADILSFDELRDSELTFMDVDPKRMERVKTIVDAHLKKEGYSQKPLYTHSRKKALEGANFMEIHTHQLAVEAILNKSRRSVYHALMMDPLTHSKLTIDEIEEVVDTLVEKQHSYLGKHLGKKN